MNFRSIAMPAIATGLAGFPRDLCAHIFFKVVEDFSFDFSPENVSIRIIRFTNYETMTLNFFINAFEGRY